MSPYLDATGSTHFIDNWTQLTFVQEKIQPLQRFQRQSSFFALKNHLGSILGHFGVFHGKRPAGAVFGHAACETCAHATRARRVQIVRACGKPACCDCTRVTKHCAGVICRQQLIQILESQYFIKVRFWWIFVEVGKIIYTWFLVIYAFDFSGFECFDIF